MFNQHNNAPTLPVSCTELDHGMYGRDPGSMVQYMPQFQVRPPAHSYMQQCTHALLTELKNNAGKNTIRIFLFNLLSRNQYQNNDMSDALTFATEYATAMIIGNRMDVNASISKAVVETCSIMACLHAHSNPSLITDNGISAEVNKWIQEFQGIHSDLDSFFRSQQQPPQQYGYQQPQQQFGYQPQQQQQYSGYPPQQQNAWGGQQQQHFGYQQPPPHAGAQLHNTQNNNQVNFNNGGMFSNSSQGYNDFNDDNNANDIKGGGLCSVKPKARPNAEEHERPHTAVSQRMTDNGISTFPERHVKDDSDGYFSSSVVEKHTSCDIDFDNVPDEVDDEPVIAKCDDRPYDRMELEGKIYIPKYQTKDTPTFNAAKPYPIAYNPFDQVKFLEYQNDGVITEIMEDGTELRMDYLKHELLDVEGIPHVDGAPTVIPNQSLATPVIKEDVDLPVNEDDECVSDDILRIITDGPEISYNYSETQANARFKKYLNTLDEGVAENCAVIRKSAYVDVLEGKRSLLLKAIKELQECETIEDFIVLVRGMMYPDKLDKKDPLIGLGNKLNDAATDICISAMNIGLGLNTYSITDFVGETDAESDWYGLKAYMDDCMPNEIGKKLYERLRKKATDEIIECGVNIPKNKELNKLILAELDTVHADNTGDEDLLSVFTIDLICSVPLSKDEFPLVLETINSVTDKSGKREDIKKGVILESKLPEMYALVDEVVKIADKSTNVYRKIIIELEDVEYQVIKGLLGDGSRPFYIFVEK